MYPALWQDTVRLSDLGAFRCTVCGHWGACLSRRRRAQTTRFRVRRSFTADNIPCVRSRELFLRRTKKARQREPAGFDVGPALSDTRMPSHRIKSDLVSHFGDSTGPAALLITRWQLDSPASRCMSWAMKSTEEDRDWDADAAEALEAARMLPPGPEKIAALKQAGMLRNIAVKARIVFQRRGRPPK